MNRAPIDVVEDAIVDHFAGRITRTQAVERIKSVIEVTTLGALELMDNPVAPRARYQRIGDETRRLLDGLGDNGGAR